MDVCGEASRPVSLCECGERPQREGFRDDRNDDVLDAPPMRVVDRAADGTPEARVRNSINTKSKSKSVFHQKGS